MTPLNWSLEQLRSFVAAAHNGSFSAAGRALGRAQSVISTHISMLEAALGVPLFNRDAHIPQLTKEGQSLLLEAEEVLRQCKKFEARALAQFKGEAGIFTMAVGFGVPIVETVNAIAPIYEAYPFLEGTFIRCSNSEALQSVEEGSCQIGLLLESRKSPKQCKMSWIGSIKQVAVVSDGHPLGKKKDFHPSELSRHRQIIVGDSRKEPLHSIDSSLYLETNDLYSALNMAQSGIGWTVLPAAMVRHSINDGPYPEQTASHLIILPQEEMQLPPADIMMIWNPQCIHKGMISTVQAHLKKAFQDADF